MLPNYKNYPLILLVFFLSVMLVSCAMLGQDTEVDLVPSPTLIPLNDLPATLQEANMINLPAPDLKGTMTLEETLLKRRSVRDFRATMLTDAQIGQLLWSAQGITHPSGFRTAPSAGALYPLEIYAATPDGLFHYEPEEHRLIKILDYDPRPDLHQAALRQDSVLEAPLVIAIAALFARTEQRYGTARTPLYVHLEAGHAAQNILLQAVAMELGAVPIGAFIDDQVKAALALPDEQMPLYLIPIGYPK
jgi:SagB-type dehydrogenase family enzyme